VEVNGKLHNWFDIDELGELVRTPTFADTLRENVERYFGVPIENQVIYDEDGLLTTAADFSRSLQGVAPMLHIYDVREAADGRREETSQDPKRLEPYSPCQDVDGFTTSERRIVNGVAVRSVQVHKQFPREPAMPAVTAGFGQGGSCATSVAASGPMQGELEVTTPLLPGRVAHASSKSLSGGVISGGTTGSRTPTTGAVTPPAGGERNHGSGLVGSTVLNGSASQSHISLRQLATGQQPLPPAVWAERRAPNQYGVLATEALEIQKLTVPYNGSGSVRNASAGVSPRQSGLVSPRTTWYAGNQAVEVGLSASRQALARSANNRAVSPGPSRTPRLSAQPSMTPQEPSVAAAGQAPTPPSVFSCRFLEPACRSAVGSQAASGTVTPTYGGAATPPSRSPVRSSTPGSTLWRSSTPAATATKPAAREATSLPKTTYVTQQVSARRSVSPVALPRDAQVIRAQLPPAGLLRPSNSQPFLQPQTVADRAVSSRSSTPVRSAPAPAWAGAPLIMPTLPAQAQAAYSASLA